MTSRLLFRELLRSRQRHRGSRHRCSSLFSTQNSFSNHLIDHSEPIRSWSQQLRPFGHHSTGKEQIVAALVSENGALLDNRRFQAKSGLDFEQDFSKIRQNWHGFDAALHRNCLDENNDQSNHKFKLHDSSDRRMWQPNIDPMQNPSLVLQGKIGSSRVDNAGVFDVVTEDNMVKFKTIHCIDGSRSFSGTLLFGGGLGKTHGGLKPQSVRYMTSGSTIVDVLHQNSVSIQSEMLVDSLDQHSDSIQRELLSITDSVTDVVAAASSTSAGLVSEVAAAAADSSFPVAALQYLMEAVHLHTALPWWGSIAVVTILVRLTTFPIVVYQMRATARLTLLRPEMEQISQKIKDSGFDPKVAEENQKRLKELFRKHNTTPFTPLLGGFVQAPIFMCFFFAIKNMAEKVPSLKEGGTLWFTDLSTPDDMYILPVLTALVFWITVELGAADGMQGQPNLEKMKVFLRALAVLMVPLTMSFPKALFCYWMTSNLFSFVQSTVLKQAEVKKMFGIPDVSHLARKQKSSPEHVATYRNPPKRGKRLQREGELEGEK